MIVIISIYVVWIVSDYELVFLFAHWDPFSESYVVMLMMLNFIYHQSATTSKQLLLRFLENKQV